ncbi:DUF1835 domain-containing protein [Cytobacillus firmus]|uniref:DUF1835 domain-containing protein n=1 Tax=Cytobacillus firmus DS1 TaxID=1307436 RepID=W7L1C0_CYTFI|nr:DUF1835 domain-containing protein [Cytobacillus firmus]EWG13200.1 hypothetical protein PBF_02225 [Cytobacillus firmus DS1]
MVDELREAIEKLPERGAKSYLFHILLRAHLLKNSADSQEEIMELLNDIQKKIIFYSQERILEREYETYHIVCGESPAGSLKVGLSKENKVIGFPDFFSNGPLWRMEEEEGRKQRFEWLMDHINMHEDYLEKEYERKIASALEEIDEIPAGKPIVIWTADNADEQTGLRYFLHLLRNKENNVHVINTAQSYKELFPAKKNQYILRHSGEAAPEKLKIILEKNMGSPLAAEERTGLVSDWQALSKTKEVLRIWEDNEIHSVHESYFDDYIIESAKKLHKSNKGFIKSARLIGEVIGHLDEPIGDGFAEYRVRSLIYNGVFAIKGIPKSMRFYSIKLKEI